MSDSHFCKHGNLSTREMQCIECSNEHRFTLKTVIEPGAVLELLEIAKEFIPMDTKRGQDWMKKYNDALTPWAKKLLKEMADANEKRSGG